MSRRTTRWQPGRGKTVVPDRDDQPVLSSEPASLSSTPTPTMRVEIEGEGVDLPLDGSVIAARLPYALPDARRFVLTLRLRIDPLGLPRLSPTPRGQLVPAADRFVRAQQLRESIYGALRTDYGKTIRDIAIEVDAGYEIVRERLHELRDAGLATAVERHRASEGRPQDRWFRVG